MTTTEIRALMAAVKRKEISERDIVPLCWRDGDRSKAYRKALAACFNSADELLDKAGKWDALICRGEGEPVLFDEVTREQIK